ncbi:hypothetical protein JXR93_01560 [bacterium]|nr:hypothetical protein [bacterium]
MNTIETLNQFKIKDNLWIFPVLHQGTIFSNLVRDVLTLIKPDRVALELPSWAKESYIKSVSKLPEITAILYGSRDSFDKYYMLIHPSEPFTEAVRFSIENGIKLDFIDSDTVLYYEHQDPFYDPFYIQQRGYHGFFDDYKDFPFKKSKEDRLREKTMGYNLANIIKTDSKTVVFLGISHYKSVIEYIESPSISIFSSFKPKVELRSLDFRTINAIHPEYPIFDYFYELLRKKTILNESQIDSFTKVKSKFKIVEGKKGDLSYLYEEKSNDIYREIIQSNQSFPDIRKFLIEIYKKAGEIYSVRYKDVFHNWQLKNMVKFGRNLMILNNGVIPDFFTALEVAKGCVDDNYAYELMELLGYYPYQPETPSYPLLDLSEIMKYHSMYIRRRDKHQAKMPIRDRKKMGKQENWAKDFSRGYICSYQPEDIVIEEFGDFLKQRARGILQSELFKSEPFISSFYEGIDIKETLRKNNGSIYIKRLEPMKGDVGSVVFIFDEDLKDDIYTYKMTWQGEHEQESDMAFYATPITSDVVGPGIFRSEYGGFLLSYPPRRVYDVWEDRDYKQITSKAEKLLMAAIDYNIQKYVVYVAKNPPKTKYLSYARRLGMDIVYMPIAAFSKTTIQKLKTFHILSSHKVRDYAKDYIF